MQYNQNRNQFPDPFGYGKNQGAFSSMLLHLISKHEIHVLLVDHDKDCLLSTAEMLESYSYKVSRVEQASTALVMLSNGWKFDLVMANAKSPELLAFRLLNEAVKMEMLVIMMSDDEDPFIARNAIDNGAFLFVKKPASMELLKYLWQFVVRERKQKDKEEERLRFLTYENNEKKMIEFIGNVPQENSRIENNVETKCKGKRKMSALCQDVDQETENKRSKYTDGFGKRVWTSELHAKFLGAIEQLGEGRCFPADILSLMNVSGLTRMQVASHLQKCRKNIWRDPQERKGRCPSTSKESKPSSEADGTQGKTKPGKRFGLMPHTASSSRGTHEPAGSFEEVPSSSEDI